MKDVHVDGDTKVHEFKTVMTPERRWVPIKSERMRNLLRTLAWPNLIMDD